MGRDKSYKLFFQIAYGLIFIVILFCVSMIVLDPRKSFQLYPYADSAVYLFADSVGANGTSEAAWIDQEQGWYSCHIGYGIQYPYCGLVLKYKHKSSPNIHDPNAFDISDATTLDLSSYDRLHISMEYEGNGNALNFYLRNALNEMPTKLEDYEELTYIHAEFDPQINPSVLDFSRLNVAKWWIDRYKLSIEQRKPRFDQVLEIGIDLPATPAEGLHVFKLHSITATKSFFLQWHLLIAIYALLGLGCVLFLVQILMAYLMRRYNEETQSLRSKMVIDPLTKCLNRLGLESVINEIFPVKENASVYLMILDLDHFKKINDTLGHAVGDEVLRKVALALSQELRADDFLGRWGGEEFIVISKIHRDKLDALISRLMEALKVVKAEGPEQSFQVSMSVGVTDARKGEAFDVVFQRADVALYEVKNSGRNNWRLA